MTALGLKPWSVCEADYPEKAHIFDKLRFILNYAVLAPSGHNTQPWLFKIAGERIDLFADRTRRLPVVDPDDRALIISCGAALFHVRIALQNFGYAVGVETFPSPGDTNLLASVAIRGQGEASSEERSMFQAIVKRHSHRLSFDGQQVPGELLVGLEQAARTEGTWLDVIREEGIKNGVADLVAKGDRIQIADKGFRRELSSWVRSSLGRSHDGMPGNAFGFTELADFATPAVRFVMRTFDLGEGQAAKDRQLAADSPVLAMLRTEADTPPAWLAAGQALSAVLLRARSEGVWASFMNQPIEVPELRPRLRDLLGRTGFPQLLLRMGYGSEVNPTPRRSVSDVLL